MAGAAVHLLTDASWRENLDPMRILDAILFVLLATGNVLALPVWWWLFGTPIVLLMKRKAGNPSSRQLP